MSRRPTIFVSQSYSEADLDEALGLALDAVQDLEAKGWAPYSPILYWHSLRVPLGGRSYREILDHCLAWARSSDALVRLSDGLPSNGAREEWEAAEGSGAELYEGVETVPLADAPSCPMCGSDKVIPLFSTGRYMPVCDYCGAEGLFSSTELGALRQWSRSRLKPEGRGA